MGMGAVAGIGLFRWFSWEKSAGFIADWHAWLLPFSQNLPVFFCLSVNPTDAWKSTAKFPQSTSSP